MSLAKVAWGWGVQNAIAQPRGGRLFVSGSHYWTADNRIGYSGFDGPPTAGIDTSYQADSRRTLGAAIEWLTGKATGADLLIMETGLTDFYGSQLQAGLDSLGHTYTFTGSPTNFGVYDPLDYDSLLWGPATLSVFTYHGLSDAQERFNYILDNKGTILCNSPLAYHTEYGITDTAWHNIVNVSSHKIHITNDGPQTGVDFPGWRYQIPFECTEFGDPGVGGSWATNYYAMAFYTTKAINLDAGANIHGGTLSMSDCALEKYSTHDTPYTGALALWRSN